MQANRSLSFCPRSSTLIESPSPIESTVAADAAWPQAARAARTRLAIDSWTWATHPIKTLKAGRTILPPGQTRTWGLFQPHPMNLRRGELVAVGTSPHKPELL